MEAKVSKTCKHCDHGEARWFGLVWMCSHPNVIAQFDPVKGRPVSCAKGRRPDSRCGVMGYCYSGPAEISPQNMGSSTIEATMLRSNQTFSAILPYRLPAPMYATNGWMQTHFPQSTIAQSNGGGGGGFLAGALVGGALVGLMGNHDHQNESPSSWEGGGGEMNGGGASDSWDDSSSDCGGGDSGGDSGGSDS